ncbi:O-antigen ligase family protein [Garciella nitratireducens]|uniref:O-antigen ligase family protein n=1 Tax=Garciella nitratireducens TaxID=218205 RepID=UPI000DEA862E|nr:O-antigen ligase family protein [Garciella nitratireducens]RBP38686.1 teichuronic acid biosynthesis protein TuaE [Garciella nitratireducens]
MFFQKKNSILKNETLYYLFNIILVLAILGIQIVWKGKKILLYRIFFALFFSILLLNFKTIEKNNRKEIKTLLHNKYIQFFLFWMAYGILSLLWVQDYVLAAKNLYYLFLGIFFIITMQFTSDYELGKKHYLNIFIICTLILITFGMFEHLTGYHISSSNYYNTDHVRNRYRPTGVFDNTNDYALFITMFIWFLYYKFKKVPHLYQKIILFLVFLCGSYLLIITSSRASILAFMIQIFLLFSLTLFESIKKKRNLRVIMNSILILIFFILFLFINYISEYGNFYDRLMEVDKWSNYFMAEEAIQSDAQKIIKEEGENTNNADRIKKSHQKLRENASTNVRLNLILNSFLIFKDTHFMGVGAGNVEWYMDKYNDQYYSTNGILNVHNWWIEVLTNYGIIVFILYIIVLFSIGVKLLKIYFYSLNNGQKDRLYLSKTLILLLIGFPLASISPSSIMSKRFVWIVFAFIIYFLQENYEKEGI